MLRAVAAGVKEVSYPELLNSEDIMNATAKFKNDWTESLVGNLVQGGELAIDYALGRLPQIRTRDRDAAVWDIVAFAQFHADGQVLAASVTTPVRPSPSGPVVDRAPAVATFPVPGDADGVELWFLNIGHPRSGDSPKAWDSRFGQNYHFAVRADSPAQPVVPRAGAQAARDVVNVLQLAVEKQRHQFSPPGAIVSAGSELRTAVHLVAWIKNITFVKNVWFDAHVYDGANQRIHAQTLPLHYKSGADGGGDLFEFDDVFYVGSRGQPGSVSSRPDARRLQLRLYCELDGQIFTDGILHDHSLPEDGAVH